MRLCVSLIVVASAAACAPVDERAPVELVVRLPDRDCHAGDETCALALDDTETGVLRVRALDVVNVGDDPGSIVGMELIGDPSYAILAEAEGEIGSRRSSPFVVGITPTSPVTLLATVFVITEPSGTIEIALSTNAFASANEPTITPASCDFGNVTVGDVSAPCSVTIANDGLREMEISLLTAVPFTAQGVVVDPMFIQPGASTAITFVAVPEAVGAVASSLSYMIDGVVHSGSTTTFVVNGVAP